MAYATISDVQARMTRTLTAQEEAICNALLEDAALIIDASAPNASDAAKLTVSCRMIARALGSADASNIPVGATQGSVAALGYSQSWTIGGGGSGELYLSKSDRALLGVGNRIGSYSPVQELVQQEAEL